MERFKKGFIFTGFHFEGRVEVIGVNKEKNKLEVHLTLLRAGEFSQWSEVWNLEHTIWGFKSGEYFEKEFTNYPKTQKQDMEEYIAAQKYKLKEAVKPDKPWWKFW